MNMLKKIILFAIIVFGLFIFYKEFVAPTVEPFYKNNFRRGFFNKALQRTPKAKWISSGEGREDRRILNEE